VTPPKTRTSNATKKSPATAKKDSASQSTPRKRSASAPRAAARPRATPGEVARQAALELSELIHKEPGDVTQLTRSDDGWRVHVEVVELRRIPETTDMMALYEVDADEHGSLESYRRLRRYVRGVPGEE
jgi:gas vesicle protein GvpO